MSSDIKNTDPVLDHLSPYERKTLLSMIRKGISRRDFMSYMIAAGATTAASGTLFTGLSDAWANTPKRGGKIIFAGDQHGPADTLDLPYTQRRLIISVGACSMDHDPSYRQPWL